MATLLGHADDHRSGRPDLRGARAVVMSDKHKYDLVERYRLDTWVFLGFFMAMFIIAHT